MTITDIRAQIMHAIDTLGLATRSDNARTRALAVTEIEAGLDALVTAVRAEASTSLSDGIANVLPQLEAMPKAQQHLIGRAMQQMVTAKQQELEAMRAFATAIKTPAHWYVVEFTHPFPGHGFHTRRVAATDEAHAREVAFAEFTPQQIGRFQKITVRLWQDPAEVTP